MTIGHVLESVALTVTAFGCLYALAAAFFLRRFMRRGEPALLATPSVTILKPLHGDEPGLFDALASFCRQRYAGRVDIVFGVQSVHDAAIPVVRRLERLFPKVNIRLVVDARRHGMNAKVSNLANMAVGITGDVVILADSDILVASDWLARVVAHLEVPGVGLVTCLYRGLARGPIWSKLSALGIDQHFLPSVVTGVSLGLAQPCLGSTIALRRDTLERIGGFDGFHHVLADDYAMGEAVRGLGLTIAIPPFVVAHGCAERRFGVLVAHDLRWARTIRAVDPFGFAGSVVTHPLPFSLMVAWLDGFDLAGLATVALALASRFTLWIQVGRSIGAGRRSLAFGPLRDFLSLAIFFASFAPGRVRWRGQRLGVRADGTLVSTDKVGP